MKRRFFTVTRRGLFVLALLVCQQSQAWTITNQALVATQVYPQPPNANSGTIEGTFTYPQFNPTNGILNGIVLEVDINDDFNIMEVNPFGFPLGWYTSFGLMTMFDTPTTNLLTEGKAVGDGFVTIPPNGRASYQASDVRTLRFVLPASDYFKAQFVGTNQIVNTLRQRWDTTQAYGFTAVGATLGSRVIYSYAPVPVSIRVSQVDICFPTETNRVYQMQYCPGLDTNAWVDFGGEIAGDGTRKCLSAAVPETEPQGFYRILTLR